MKHYLLRCVTGGLYSMVNSTFQNGCVENRETFGAHVIIGANFAQTLDFDWVFEF